jgi:hypothetical protein
MSWRLLVIFLLLAGIGLGYWWLDNFLLTQAWASHDGKAWQLAAQGWETVLHAWPVALAGLLLGGGLTLVLAVYSYTLAEEADHRQQLHRLQASVESANNAAKLASQRAWEGLEDQRQALENREKQLQSERQLLAQQREAIGQQMRQAQEIARAANERVQQAEKDASFAKVKRDRAAGAFHRLKQKAPDAL